MQSMQRQGFALDGVLLHRGARRHRHSKIYIDAAAARPKAWTKCCPDLFHLLSLLFLASMACKPVCSEHTLPVIMAACNALLSQ